ncbi:MAG TPA: hypothetical protein VG734_11025 [Lacunisphaera sp.]|nr:hypothetical protein [Lacunisphaera sp.]
MKVPPLGDAQFVRDQISKSLPGVNWSNPAWGVLEGKGWSIEFNHQTSGPTDSVMLHVRGGGDPISAIVKLCKDNGWVAMDAQDATLIDLNKPSDKTWKEFQGYRDKLAAGISTPPPPPASTEMRAVNIGISVLFFAILAWLLIRWSNR